MRSIYHVKQRIGLHKPRSLVEHTGQGGRQKGDTLISLEAARPFYQYTHKPLSMSRANLISMYLYIAASVEVRGKRKMSEIKEKHYVEISRKGDDDKYYRWGVYDLHESNEVLALIQSAWEFGLHQQNYGIGFVEGTNDI